MKPKVKYELEFPIHSSPQLLYQYIFIRGIFSTIILGLYLYYKKKLNFKNIPGRAFKKRIF